MRSRCEGPGDFSRVCVLGAAILVLALGLGWTGPVRANGAFPDSLQLLLPADHPKRIIMSTTFGLIMTEDDGQTWSWTCEQENTTNAGLYQVGSAPQDRLYALTDAQLAFSDDQSCNWQLSSGALSTGVINDAFPDPNNPNHVLALGISGAGTAEVVASADSGTTFNMPIFVAPAGAALTSVEIARADPKVLYVAMFQTPGIHPRLIRSNDGGAHWNDAIDVEPMLGAAGFRIIAVDPTDPDRIYLRVLAGFQNILAISEDGGLTFRTPLTFDTMSAFVRLSDGTILVAGQKDSAPVAYRSTDTGKTFVPWSNAPSVRALAERGGRLYVSADNVKDGFALAVSDDGGQTLRPLMSFDKVTSVRGCVREVCAASCATQVMLKLWSADVCGASATKPPPGPPAAKSGCSAGSDRQPRLTPAGCLGLLGVLALSWIRRRSRPRR